MFVSSPGSRRSSDYPDEEGEQKENLAGLTEQQKEELRWYYRTEDREYTYLSVVIASGKTTK